MSFTLVACGGGSDGSSPSTGGGVPVNPPAPPALGYTGQTQQASAAETQGDAFAATLIEAIRDLYAVSALAVDEPIDALFTNGVLDETVPGDGGGTARLTGRLASDGTGWIAAEYRNFVDDGATISGREVQQILARITPTAGRVRMSFTDLRVQDGAESYRLNGTVTRHDIDRPAGRFDISGDVMVERDGAPALRAGPLDLVVTTRTDAAGRVAQIGATGRSFVADAGFVEVDALADWVFEADADELAPSPLAGESRLRGSAGRNIVLAALNSSFGSLVFESPDTGPRQRRFDWSASDIAPVPGNRLLLAGAGAERTVLIGQPVRLEGRFAVHRHGTALAHDWRLLAAPPGSTAELVDADSPTPTLTPDRNGTYLIEQRVGDGQDAAYDTLRLFVTPDPEDPRLAALAVDAGPDLAFAPGEILQLDGRRTAGPDGRAPLSVAWGEFVEDRFRFLTGRHLQFAQPNARTTSVTTSRPGYYEVMLSVIGEAGVALQMLYVDYPWRFRPPHYLLRDDGIRRSLGGFVVGDVDGSGFPDIVSLDFRENFGDSVLRLWRGLGSGALAEAIELEFSLELSQASTLRDGLVLVDATHATGLEIVTARQRHLLIFELTPEGTLHQTRSLETLVDCEVGTTGTRHPALQAADLTGNGRLDLVRVIPCQQDAAIEILLRQVDGDWLALAPLPLPRFDKLAVGDMNGDGLADLVIQRSDEQNRTLIEVGYGDGQGGFTFTEVFEASDLGFTLGDIDNDGRLDIVTLVFENNDERSLVTLRQSASGSLETFETPVVTDLALEGFALDVVDLDGDGLPDLVSHGFVASVLLRQREPFVFAPAVELPLRRPWGSVAYADRAWVDFDGDGLVDFIGVETRASPEARGLGIVFQAPAQYE
ncbi:MAG: VCBS repeat-containing protein [Gammaproteobacteria bacterium]|nr:VCBS repeat-containing protein [Gammaproteobacteria bacterium]